MMNGNRLQNQLKQIQRNPPDYWSVQPINDLFWIVNINCDPSIPYEGEPFKLLITFQQNYPLTRPFIRVDKQDMHRIFHPNIGFNGSICQQTVNSQQKHLRVRQRIEAFMNLLKIPNPKSPMDSQAAQLYLKDQKQFFKYAKAIYRGIKKK